MDVANGVRGEIVGIVLNEQEDPSSVHGRSTIHLHYPPRFILVKLNRTKAPTLEGLPPNVIPIVPVNKTFTVTNHGSHLTVTRTQLPLTPAYAFTDYRSQGLTIDPVFVDIGRPPYGYLTPFNIYVALSRGTSQKHIRLLRDFDEFLPQQYPSEFLRVEDERLQALNHLIKQIWHTQGEKPHYGDPTSIEIL